MKAKMTDYKGVYFRSRLEARWCEFFEFLGVRFEYEPEKQYTSIGGYIPDFYFRSLKAWVEIKGVKATDNEVTKLEDVCRATSKFGIIISGYPKVFPHGVEPHTANCTCYFISNKGESVALSFDELYQLVREVRILYMLDKCKPSSMVGINIVEFHRYKNLKPAKARFKPNKSNMIDTVKLASKVLSMLSDRLNSRII